MALISCPECTTDVSDRAPACPKCGAPIASARDVDAIGEPLITTQETSKHLKLHVLFAVLAMFIGGLFIWLEVADPTEGSTTFPILLFLAGFAWYLITKLRIWWHHE